MASLVALLCYLDSTSDEVAIGQPAVAEPSRFVPRGGLVEGPATM